MFRRVVLAAAVFSASMMADNDYCVKCADGSVKKCRSANGGEVGMVECGVRNSGCSISYWDGRYCHLTGPTRSNSAALATSEPGDITVTMPKAQWDKLLKLLQVDSKDKGKD
jgi:hypothetical protein